MLRFLVMTQKTLPFIRRATARDAALLADLGARTFQDTFAADNTPEDMAAYLSTSFSPEIQSAELADPNSTFLIAEVDKVAAGYAKLCAGETPACVTGPKPIELVRLYVDIEWLGRGVGEALMRDSIDRARQQGHETMWLGVWEHNRRAQAFYRKWGFRAVGEHVFQLGSDPQTDLILERSLR
jgi:ribosomal protein S18 acetylase RimI-like enzyme